MVDIIQLLHNNEKASNQWPEKPLRARGTLQKPTGSLPHSIISAHAKLTQHTQALALSLSLTFRCRTAEPQLEVAIHPSFKLQLAHALSKAEELYPQLLR